MSYFPIERLNDTLLEIIPPYRKLEQGRNRAVRSLLSGTKFEHSGNYTDTGNWQADAPKRKIYHWPAVHWKKIGRPRIKFTVNGQEFEWGGNAGYDFHIRDEEEAKSWYLSAFPGRKQDKTCFRLRAVVDKFNCYEINDGRIEMPPVIQDYWKAYSVSRKVSNYRVIAKGFNSELRHVYAVRPHQLLLERTGKHLCHYWWHNAKVIFGHMNGLRRKLKGYGHFTYLPWFGHLNHNACAILDVTAPDGDTFRIWHWDRNKMAHANDMNDQCVAWAGTKILTTSPV
jgi:hypothetical protein